MVASNPRETFWKGLMLGAFAVGLRSSCVFFFLFFFYLTTLKSTPEPNIGRIYALDNHGWIVYITHEQTAQLNFLEALGFVGMLVAALVKYCVYPKQ